MTRPAAWPPPLPDDVLLERWRPSHAADLAELRAVAGLGPCEGIESVVRNLETGKREIVLQLRPAPAGLDTSRTSATDTSSLEPRRVAEAPRDPSVERAIATCRARWADVDVDALEVERALHDALPGRSLLLLTDGRARAFERLDPDPRTGRPRWRSMYVFTPSDVRRFAEGATR